MPDSPLIEGPIYVRGEIGHEAFPDVTAFHHIWDSARNGRFAPRWQDLDFLAFPPHMLPLMYLVDVERNPLSFRYRFIGTKVCEFEGADYTGKYACDLEPRKLGLAAHRAFATFIENPQPTFFMMLGDERGETPHMFRVYGGIRVALSNDGEQVDQILALAQLEYDHRELRRYFFNAAGDGYLPAIPDH